MIKNFRARVMVDPRGKIKTGMKAKNSEGKEYPKSLDHFNVVKFPELVEQYGEKPAAFVIQFPSNEPIDFFDCNYEHWSGRKKEGEQGVLIRRCDGETCLHRINEEIAGKKYAAGEESRCVCLDMKEDDKKRCGYTAYLKAWIVSPQTGNIENPLCYLFETHSRNSGDAIYSALNDVRVLTNGVLRGIRFSLSVRMVAGKEDAKMKFPIWTLLPLGTVTEMRNRAKMLTEAKETPPEKLLPLLSKIPPGSLEDLLKQESRARRERITKEIQSVSTIANLSKKKEEINKMLSEALLVQTDYDDLLDSMKARYEALKGD